MSVSDALGELDRQLRDRAASDVRTVASGFPVLDETLGGGLHVGELLLLGGPPGVGKTIAALQWARNVAKAGHRAVFVCYEHEPTTLLTRLLALEAGEAGGDRSIARTLNEALSDADQAGHGLAEVLGSLPLGDEVRKRVAEYAEDLILVRGSGAHTTLDSLADVLAPHLSADRRTILFVDYLQKIPLHPAPATESEKVTRTVEGLKDLALDAHVPVVLLSAVDAAGMQANRLRMHHLRGSSAIAFESDVVVMMNHKDQAVSKVHLSYDAVRARTFREWVVMSIEKNRGGPNLIDLEFRKDFPHFRFDPEGGIVSETLVDERLDEAAL
ncbi:DnaB-like helicase C-terminal domain-containing protein [Nitriliruptor alkaliphilus]|uniref:DnaB-like helicase C-terminal domain-containing protein n=1 Tax=Nitriliruptor alkaliphilus TaxID=427918 RepID=UPI00146FC8E3|nr:DnaB-like helicase C-terminal domain-containing protein [Nitriliruptor alkaliphilus]